MRFAVVAALILAIAVAPAPARAGMVFAGFTCRQTLPCDQTDPSFPETAQLVAIANSCVTQNTGFSSPDGIFDEAAGVDNNGCFKTKVVSTPGGSNSLHSIPECCIGAVPGKGCRIQCNMISQ